MAKKTPKVKWTGDLATPIQAKGPRFRNRPTTILGGVPGVEEQAKHAARYDAEIERQFAEYLRKIGSLQKHYGTPDGVAGLIPLVIILAQQANIPGFRVIRRGEGRMRRTKDDARRTWFDGRCICLILDVEIEKARLGVEKDKEAVRSILRRPSRYNVNNRKRSEDEIEKQAKELASRLSEARRRVREKGLEDFCDHTNPLMRKIFVENREIREIFEGVTFGD